MWDQVKHRCSKDELPYLSCIYGLLERYRPQSVVEIGSGLLTAAISAYAPARFVSLPISKEQAKTSAALLGRFGVPVPAERWIVTPGRERVSCCKSGHRVELPDEQFDFFLVHKYWTLYGFVEGSFQHTAGMITVEQGADLKVRKELEGWQTDRQRAGSLVIRESFLWDRIIAFTRSPIRT